MGITSAPSFLITLCAPSVTFAVFQPFLPFSISVEINSSHPTNSRFLEIWYPQLPPLNCHPSQWRQRRTPSQTDTFCLAVLELVRQSSRYFGGQDHKIKVFVLRKKNVDRILSERVRHYLASASSLWFVQQRPHQQPSSCRYYQG